MGLSGKNKEQGRKSTMVELVEALEAKNSGGLYDGILAKAKAGRYHDAHHVDGKAQFLRDTEQFPGLVDVRLEIRRGVYDEDLNEDT